MKKLIETFWNAVTLMAAADVEYWMARQYLADPEVADLIALSLMPGLEPAQRLSTRGPAGDTRAEAREAIAQAEALLASSRRDLVGSA